MLARLVFLLQLLLIRTPSLNHSRTCNNLQDSRKTDISGTLGSTWSRNTLFSSFSFRRPRIFGLFRNNCMAIVNIKSNRHYSANQVSVNFWQHTHLRWSVTVMERHCHCAICPALPRGPTLRQLIPQKVEWCTINSTVLQVFAILLTLWYGWFVKDQDESYNAIT